MAGRAACVPGNVWGRIPSRSGRPGRMRASSSSLPGGADMHRFMRRDKRAELASGVDLEGGYTNFESGGGAPLIGGRDSGELIAGDPEALAAAAAQVDPLSLSAEFNLAGGAPIDAASSARGSRGGSALTLEGSMGQMAGQMALNRSRARDPPDLPSYILDQRIVWLGMEIVPSVAELIVAELLYLASENTKPVYIYVSSKGTQNEKKQSLSMDTDAYGIVDTMNYINARGQSRKGKVDRVGTVSMSLVEGNAALIAANGSKGHRWAYEHTRFKLAVPRMNGMSGVVTNMMIWANNLESMTETYVELLANGTGRSVEQTWKDVNRDTYMWPQDAIEYGLIDKVMPNQEQYIDKKKRLRNI